MKIIIQELFMTPELDSLRGLLMQVNNKTNFIEQILQLNFNCIQPQKNQNDLFGGSNLVVD